MYHGKYEAKKGTAPRTGAKNTAAAATKVDSNKKKKNRTGSIIFYFIYFLLIAGFFLMLFGALNALEDWLIQYEGSQPDVKCEEVFNQLFKDPDWKAVYALANEEDTSYDSADSYAAYMEQKVGDNSLTYTETSAGLSGDHKYVVKLGKEKIAVFTLTDQSQSDSELELKEWELGGLELFYERTASVTICAQPDRIVTVNGIVLEESHVISSTTTLAEEYLPEGEHGYRMQTQYVDDLMVAPQVVVTDENGNPVEMTYNEATQTYTEVIVPLEMTDEKDTITDAIQTYGKYMIEAATKTQLAKYFDSNEQAYKSIVRSDVSWTQNFQGYEFTEAVITGYYRYSDSLFSAHVEMTMNVTRRDGTIKEFPVQGTFFFRHTGSKWVVTEMTNIDVQEQQTQIRLTYLLDGQTLSSQMIAADVTSLTSPAVEVPEGKVFSGWFRETVDANGEKTMSLVFKPDSSGVVTLPADYVLEPMTLHALFENKGES